LTFPSVSWAQTVRRESIPDEKAFPLGESRDPSDGNRQLHPETCCH
jgi:hypothetical protein